jgi:hypothetical protein
VLATVAKARGARHAALAKRKRDFIANALADFETDAKWKSPRSLGLMVTQGEDLYAA